MKDASNPEPSLLILVILYKQKLDEAPTIASLAACGAALRPEDAILLWDNSPEAQEAETLGRFSQSLAGPVSYVHHPENAPLSYAYNEAVRQSGDHDLLLFLDQDSCFEAGYIADLRQSAAVHTQINLFAPLIRHGDRVVSPGHFQYFKGKYWQSARTGLVSANRTVAIMSGLGVRRSYLESFGGFDERLRLYGIDTNLLLRYAKTNEQFYVLGANFGHDLSDFNEEPASVKRRRFRDFRQASLINAELFPAPVRWLTRLFLFYKGLQLAWRERSAGNVL